jgi:pathogenesis-related protein 1
MGQYNEANNMKISLAILIFSALHLAYAAEVLTTSDKAEIVAAHNNWRSQVNIPGVKWSPKLEGTSQSYAETLKSTQACNLSHSQASDYGENLFWASPTSYSDGRSEVQTVTPTQVVDDWGSEQADYDASSNTCAWGKACGHYTQMVWKNTTEVGCGKAVCPDNSQIWVCHYQPAGNYIGEHPYR